MTNTARQSQLTDYAIDLLYTINAKRKRLHDINELTIKIVFTESDLDDLRDILINYTELKEVSQ